ncbi:MAG: hypothetical protein N0C81_10100 [Candidatus Thiodiazotropha lotti]|nr:hypothetical protein [Candidatus Thiodiazotropha lotti]MCW4195570.1 hypothetical protein [Candidatus Thiodiazotropha lotti]
MKESSFIVDLSTVIFEESLAQGIPEKLAISIANRTKEFIQNKYACDRVYINTLEKRERNIEVLKQWMNGIPKNTIARLHGLSVSTVNRIIAKELKIRSE